MFEGGSEILNISDDFACFRFSTSFQAKQEAWCASCLISTTYYCRSNWSVAQILIQYITSGWPIHLIKFLEIFIHFLWKSQFQVFDHFWSLPFYLWLVSCTNNKGDWCIQTIQQEVYNYTRKCMNISRNLMKWIGQPEVMYWINIWATLQLERQ